MSFTGKKYCPICGMATRDTSETCENCGSEFHEAEQFEVVTHHEAVMDEIISHENRSAAEPASSSSSSHTTSRRQTKSTKTLGKSGTKKIPSVQSNSSGAIVLQTKHLAWLIIGLVILLISTILYYETRETSKANEGAVVAPPQGIDLAKLDRLKARVESNPNDIEAVLKYANALHDAQLPDQAIPYYQKFLSVHPDNADARVDMGVCYFERKDYATAMKEIETAVTAKPDHQIGTFNLGIVNLNAGNKTAAIEWFQKAIKLSPDSKMAETAKQIISENQ